MTDKIGFGIGQIARQLSDKILPLIFRRCSGSVIDDVVKNHFNRCLGTRLASNSAHPILCWAVELRNWTGCDVVVLTAAPGPLGRITMFQAITQAHADNPSRRAETICLAGATGIINHDRPVISDA